MLERVADLPLFQSATGMAGQIGDALRDLPMPVHALYIALLVAGGVVWFFGNKLLRPVFALAGAAIGGAAGFFFASLFGLTQWLADLGPYVGLVIGGVVGLALALMLFRVAIGVATAAVLGAALATGSAAYLRGDLRPLHENAVQRIQASAAAAMLEQGGEQPGEGEAAQTGGSSATELGKRFLESAWREAGALLEEIPARERLVIAGAWLVGTVGGFFLGVALANHLSIGVTSMLGSGMLLVSAVWFAGAYSVPFLRDLPLQPRAAITVWLALSVVGMVLQWRFTREKDDSKAKREKQTDEEPEREKNK